MDLLLIGHIAFTIFVRCVLLGAGPKSLRAAKSRSNPASPCGNVLQCLPRLFLKSSVYVQGECPDAFSRSTRLQ